MLIFRILLFLVFIVNSPTILAEQQQTALLLKLDGVIGPATQDYVHRGLQLAASDKDSVVILQIDTPGGLSDSMRGIVEDILASPIPILAYVAPSGARAASAGTYIVYASNIAAMAPGTNIGAATPVNLGGTKKESSKQSAEQKKMMQDAQAYIRSLAELRHRNVEWAQAAVNQAASLSANQALEQKVIDFIAVSPQDLLKQASSKINIGQNIKIKTLNPDWRTRLLSTITHPTIAYILLIVGVYGLLFELLSPGFLLPGIAGIIALLLGLYAFQLLPIDYTGLALIILGIAFIVAELYLPAFGALGIGGAIAFLVGSIMLMKPAGPALGLPLSLILGITGLTLLFFLGMLGSIIRARRRPIVSGLEGMIGQIGEVIINQNELWILVSGERWQAQCDQPLRLGERVKIVEVQGLILFVKPLTQ